MLWDYRQGKRESIMQAEILMLHLFLEVGKIGNFLKFQESTMGTLSMESDRVAAYHIHSLY